MVLLETPEAKRDFKAPQFTLKGTDGKTYSYDDIKGKKGTVIAFICNHCPYVKAIIERMAQVFSELEKQEFGVAAIMPNDTEKYPEDNFENMQKFSLKHGFTFPYLLDEDQRIAKAYGAVCTPDIYGFDTDDILKYRGRLDNAGSSQTPSKGTKKELMEAMHAISQDNSLPFSPSPSMGCSIKWKD